MKALVLSFVLPALAGPALGTDAQAAAKKPRSNSGSTGAPTLQTPQPIRAVYLRPVTTKAFQLPNGERVNLQADLDVMNITSVTEKTPFSPTDVADGGGLPVTECGHHIEIRAAVTTLELNVAQVGVRFGYTPSGEHSVVSGVNGEAQVNLGTLAMDFSVWECVSGRCSAVAASTASHLTAGVALDFEIDFGLIKTGPSLVYNTPLGKILRKVINDGMAKIAASSRLSELGWQAVVREFDSEAGSVIFDAGAESRLFPDQAFSIYAVEDSASPCDVYKVVAYAHTSRVDAISSVALIDQLFGNRGIRAGDRVMVRKIAK